MKLESNVSPPNSSTTPLQANASFVGTSEDVSGFQAITMTCLTNVSCTVFMEFSQDNSNWDISDQFDVAANTREDQ